VLGDEEHEAANDAHGVLADLCDILFDDPERASTQGHDGIIERAAALVDAEVSAHLRIRQCYDNTVTTAWRDAVAKAEAGRDKSKTLQVAQAHAMWEANSENAVLRRQVAQTAALLRRWHELPTYDFSLALDAETIALLAEGSDGPASEPVLCPECDGTGSTHPDTAYPESSPCPSCAGRGVLGE